MRSISLNNKKAFTMIELVLVMFIICLLSYIVFSNSTQSITNANSEASSADAYFSSLDNIEFTFSTTSGT